MSKYSLPGLFPPLPKLYDYAGFDTPTSNENGESSSNSSTSKISSSSSSSNRIKSEASHGLPMPPLVQSREEGDVCSSIEPRSERQEAYMAADRLGISVKEAKIDSALLVKSLANNDKSTSSPRSRRKRVVMGESKNEPPSSQDEAMKFELYVVFGGRKYTTIRSWPSICKFRKDLIRNVRSSCEIPELPNLHPPGVLCRSFSFLHNLVSSYVPTLDGWLQKVTQLVPHDNEILSHFLYESDIDPLHYNSILEKELEKRSSCSQLLDAIEESDSEDENEDDRQGLENDHKMSPFGQE